MDVAALLADLDRLVLDWAARERDQYSSGDDADIARDEGSVDAYHDAASDLRYFLSRFRTPATS